MRLLHGAEAFQVVWGVGHHASEEAVARIAAGTRCHRSAFLQERYNICGAKGAIPDRPVAVFLDPWTGRFEEPASFTAFAKPQAGRERDLPHKVSVKVTSWRRWK